MMRSGKGGVGVLGLFTLCGPLAYCVMPNHWHLVVWLRQDGNLSRLMNWLALTHTQRRHQHRHGMGEGDVYQGLKGSP